MELNDRTFLLYAAKHYVNPCCMDISEFYEDVSRFKYLKKLLKRYKDKGELQERLILNHIIIIGNSFGINAGVKLCFFKIPEEHWPALKTFMLYLNYIHPEEYINIPSDIYVARKLQLIK